MDLAMEGALDDEAAGAERGNVAWPVPVADEPAVAEGQVRLLHPCVLAAGSGPRYVAVLAAEGKNACLAAPFSRYAAPAVPGEALTGIDTPGLRVLCLWNAFVLPAHRLAWSWLAGALSAAQQADMLAVAAHVREDAPLAAELLARTGPPLRHPLDPRRAYLEEEEQLLQGFANPHPLEPDAGWDSSERDYLVRELPRAAEVRAVYGRSLRYAVSDTGLFLKCVMQAEETWLVEVQDRHGNASALLDGAVLRTGDGRASPPLREARATMAGPLLRAGMYIVTVHGAPLPLRLLQ